MRLDPDNQEFSQEFINEIKNDPKNIFTEHGKEFPKSLFSLATELSQLDDDRITNSDRETLRIVASTLREDTNPILDPFTMAKFQSLLSRIFPPKI